MERCDFRRTEVAEGRSEYLRNRVRGPWGKNKQDVNQGNVRHDRVVSGIRYRAWREVQSAEMDGWMSFQSGDSIRVVHPLFHVEGGGSIPTSPLQLNIGEISLDLAISLNALWHSRLPVVVKSNVQRVRHNICFGAEYAGVFYASAIWTDPIARLLNGRNWLELRRLAISDDAPRNTASRILKIMAMQIVKKWPHIERLVSYQDCDVHSGTIYAASGWTVEAENKNGSWIRESRDRSFPQAPGRKVRWGRALNFSSKRSEQ